MIDTMKQKREALNFQREQLAANLNFTAGQVAMLDELIAEHEKAASGSTAEKPAGDAANDQAGEAA